MLTPQDVKSKEFTKAVFGGYDMATVDDFLDAVAEDYSALYKENAILKNKLKVLVEKVEEYRSTEDSMRLALLTAQKMSKEITDEAEAKARDIMENAETNARRRIENLRIDAREEELKLETAKARTADFVATATEQLRRQIELLENMDIPDAAHVPAPAPVPAPAAKPDPVDETAKSIEDSLARIFEQSGAAAQEKATVAAVSDDHEDEAPRVRPKFEFQNLQFGSNYEQDK